MLSSVTLAPFAHEDSPDLTCSRSFGGPGLQFLPLYGIHRVPASVANTCSPIFFFLFFFFFVLTAYDMGHTCVHTYLGDLSQSRSCQLCRVATLNRQQRSLPGRQASRKPLRPQYCPWAEGLGSGTAGGAQGICRDDTCVVFLDSELQRADVRDLWSCCFALA